VVIFPKCINYLHIYYIVYLIILNYKF